MSEETKQNTGAGSAGVTPPAGSPNPNNIGGSAGPDPKEGAGEPNKGTQPGNKDEGAAQKTVDTVPKAEYEKLKTDHEALETKLGTQGTELGENRELMESLRPLMEKLNASPELITAITSGKLTGDLATAALEGKISVKEAETVAKAHEEVKEDLGKKEYAQAKPEDVEKLIADKVGELSKKFDTKFEENEEIRRYTEDVKTFLLSKGDKFDEYAGAVDEYRTAHPEITDIRVIWDAVVGAEAQKARKKQDEEGVGEAAKDMAANAGGGTGVTTGVIKDKNLADQLIAGKTNANVFN